MYKFIKKTLFLSLKKTLFFRVTKTGVFLLNNNERLTLLSFCLTKLPFMNSGFTEINDFNDVVYCKAEGNYTRIFLPDKCVLSARVLRCIEQILPTGEFLRIHKSYIVNVNYI